MIHWPSFFRGMRDFTVSALPFIAIGVGGALMLQAGKAREPQGSEASPFVLVQYSQGRLRPLRAFSVAEKCIEATLEAARGPWLTCIGIDEPSEEALGVAVLEQYGWKLIDPLRQKVEGHGKQSPDIQ